MVDENSKATNEDTKTQARDRSAALMSEVANRILEAHNILIAVSSDPSVDELSAAVGLSVCLDKAGKHATTVFSGTIPSAIEFLKPSDIFETSADALQDFVITLNKEKADHLRYKLEDDSVRIFITPYKTRISQDDLNFSYGDFNIDLVLALNVANGTDLDGALREHGRIMHDAKVVNITTANPGKFGEVEWSDKSKSSVSEMAAELLYSMKKIKLEKEEATALLAGIIAATNRFSNAATTPATMQMAAKLMSSGANQQVVAENITDATSNQSLSFDNELAENDEPAEAGEPKEIDKPAESSELEEKSESEDASSIDVEHESEDDSELEAKSEDKPEEKSEQILESSLKETPDESLDAAIASFSKPAEEAEETSKDSEAPKGSDAPKESETSPILEAPELKEPEAKPEEKVVAPSLDFLSDTPASDGKDYSQMLADALAEDSPAAPTPMATPISSAPSLPDENLAAPTPNLPTSNPAASMAPEVSKTPEINGVPEINYNETPGSILPPPPAPAASANTNDFMPPAPAPDPAAFQIPTTPSI